MAPRLRSCCCGCFLRTGTLMIIIYNLIWVVSLFGIEMYFRIIFDAISPLSIFTYILVIGSHVLGVLGLASKKYLMLLPFIILQWIYLVLLGIFVTLYAINKDEFYYEVIGFIAVILVKSANPDLVKPALLPDIQGATHRPITEQDIRKWLLNYIRKNPNDNPLPVDFEKQKSHIIIGTGVLVAISFILNLYFAIVVISCLLEMREEEMGVPRRKIDVLDDD